MGGGGMGGMGGGGMGGGGRVAWVAAWAAAWVVGAAAWEAKGRQGLAR